jgi:hypothetical protein
VRERTWESALERLAEGYRQVLAPGDSHGSDTGSDNSRGVDDTLDGHTHGDSHGRRRAA